MLEKKNILKMMGYIHSYIEIKGKEGGEGEGEDEKE